MHARATGAGVARGPARLGGVVVMVVVVCSVAGTGVRGAGVLGRVLISPGGKAVVVVAKVDCVIAITRRGRVVVEVLAVRLWERLARCLWGCLRGCLWGFLLSLGARCMIAVTTRTVTRMMRGGQEGCLLGGRFFESVCVLATSGLLGVLLKI